MRVIRFFEILVAFALMLIFAAALVGGVFRWPFFILAAVALGIYFVWEFVCLRCPWCGSVMEPSRLARGLRRPCHCPSCGHEITVVWRVNTRVPEHGPDSEEELPEEPDPAPEPEKKTIL